MNLYYNLSLDNGFAELRYRMAQTTGVPFRHSGKQSSAVGVAEFSSVKVISHDTSTTVPVKVVPGSVPWIQDPAIVY